MRATPTRRTGAFARALTALTLLLPGLALAQSLQELYEAARAYDATYLSARALADSAQYRAEQAEALRRPSASLSASTTRTEVTLPQGYGSGSANATGASLNGSYPLFNRGNDATIDQAHKSLLVARADLETAEQDLIVRVAQAYFDVLASRRTRWPPRAPARPRSPNSWHRPSATSRSAPPPSPTPARRRRASTSPPRRRSRPRTTCAPSASRSTSWWAAPASLPKPLATPVVLPATAAGRRRRPGSTTADSGHPPVRKARLALDIAQLETEKARAGRACRRSSWWARSAPTDNGGSATSNRTGGTTQRGRSACS